MKRERLIPLALATGALIAISACTSDGRSTSSEGSTETSQPDAPPRTTTATPSTLPGTDPTTTEPGDDPVRPQAFGSSRLSFFGDCPALLDYMQTEATARVTPWGLGGQGYYYAYDVFLE